MRKILTIIILLIPSLCISDENKYEICLAPIKDSNNKERSLANPEGGRTEPYKYSIIIGNIEFQQNSLKTQCEKYSSKAKIPVIVFNNGIKVESFFINTKERKNGSCIWFKSLYETWSVWPISESKHICK